MIFNFCEFNFRVFEITENRGCFVTKLTSVRCPLQKEQGGERPSRRSLPTGRRWVAVYDACRHIVFETYTITIGANPARYQEIG